MKTFKQLREELPTPVTPKQIDVIKSDTRFIRTPDVIKKENQKFRSLYPFPSSFLPNVFKSLLISLITFLLCPLIEKAPTAAVPISSPCLTLVGS